MFCPDCNILVEAKVVAEGNGGFRGDAISPLEEIDTEYNGEHYYVCLCGRCSHPFLIRPSLFGIPAEFESVTDETILYPSESELPLDGVPTLIRTAYEQATRSYSASFFEPCVLMCLEMPGSYVQDYGSSGT